MQGKFKYRILPTMALLKMCKFGNMDLEQASTATCSVLFTLTYFILAYFFKQNQACFYCKMKENGEQIFCFPHMNSYFPTCNGTHNLKEASVSVPLME